MNEGRTSDHPQKDGSASVTVEVLRAVTFANWLAGFFPEAAENPELLDPNATPQGDGVPNFAKYALGIDPTRPMTAGDQARFTRVSRVIPGEQARLELKFVLQAGSVDVGLTMESSPNAAAGAWGALDANDMVIREELTAAGRELTVLVPPALETDQFYLLRFTYIPAP